MLLAILQSAKNISRHSRRFTSGYFLDAAHAAETFVQYTDVKQVLASGETKCSVVLRSGLQVDLRIVPESSYGAALCYFTGSKAHNIAVRRLALKRRLKINEYGVFRRKRRIAGRTGQSARCLCALSL